MDVLQTPDEAYAYVSQQRLAERTVGLIPTMGALHAGHLSLAQAAVDRCDSSVATIFVNPTQFAPGEDLGKYPRTLEEDLGHLESIGVSAAFCPEPESIYPPGFSTAVKPPSVAQPLEGECRPIHFEGVATIVLKLFQMLPATHAFFGQKDFQQLRVIESMVRDLNVPIEVVPCPTIREPDGLAMSSRNRYLDEAERSRALVLGLALQRAGALLRDGVSDTKLIVDAMLESLNGNDGRPGVDSIDYAVIADPVTLLSLDRVTDSAALLIAAHVGSTRLIDNLIWAVDPTTLPYSTGFSTAAI